MKPAPTRRPARLLAALALVAPLCGQGRADPGVSAERILLGQSVVLSGPLAENGMQYRKGIDLYLEQLNARGGINGRRVELLTLDDGYDPKRTEQNTRMLIEEKQVFALFGYSGTGSALAALPVAEKARIPLFAPLSGADALRVAKSPVLATMRASYGDEMDKIVEQQTTLGINKIALAYQNDGFGQSTRQGFEAAMARHDLKPAAIGGIDPANVEASARAAAAEIAKAAPAAVILGTAGRISPAIIREVLKTGLRPQFFGLSVISPAVLRQELGPDAAGIVISQVVPSPWSPRLPVVRQYREALAAHKEEAHYVSLEGYLAARVMTEALKRSGKEPTRGGFLKAMAELRDFDVGGFVVNYGPNRHYGSTYVDLAILLGNGQFVQ